MLEGAWNAWRFHLSPGKTDAVWRSTSSAGTRQIVRDWWRSTLLPTESRSVPRHSL